MSTRSPVTVFNTTDTHHVHQIPPSLVNEVDVFITPDNMTILLMYRAQSSTVNQCLHTGFTIDRLEPLAAPMKKPSSTDSNIGERIVVC